MVKYVLVLEGGGVRSALGLQFLTELEKCYEVNLSENVDVFAGGNTSAVTALAFAQGKSAQNILSVMYEESQPQTLMLKSSSSSSLQHLYKSRPLYPVESKNNVLTKILENESIHSLDKVFNIFYNYLYFYSFLFYSFISFIFFLILFSFLKQSIFHSKK